MSRTGLIVLSEVVFKVTPNRLSPAAQNNLFQPMCLMSYFRMAQNFASVQLNLCLKSCCVIACDVLV